MSTVDVLLTNGNVVTLDDNMPLAGSVAVSKGRIVGMWRTTEPPRDEVTLSSHTQVVDLGGKTVLPGFIDTHSHPMMYAQCCMEVDCRIEFAPSISVLVENLRARAKTLKPGQWLLGWGYDDTLLAENRHPTREELDSVGADCPIYIRHISGHSAVVNSQALLASGISETSSDPFGGHFGRDSSGRLNGLLEELPAMHRVQEKMPGYSLTEFREAMGVSAREYVEQGITTCTDAAVGLIFGLQELDVHMSAIEMGKNPMRMRFMMMHNFLRAGERFGDHTAAELDAYIQEASNGKARLDSAKLFQDGSIQLRTAALRMPYHTPPSTPADLMHRQEDFNEEVLNLHRRGYRIATHGNGDRAIGSIIDAYQYALEREPRNDHRHRIEHVQTATSQDLKRMSENQIAASFFVNHIYYWGDRHKALFLGEERASHMNPVREAVEHGLLMTFHSDCPITPISPLFNIWAAVNRVTRNGEVLGPDQRCTVDTAIRAMTSMGATLNFEESETGTISPGKRADFVILEENPYQVDPKTIKDISVLGTVVGGEFVFVKPGYEL